MGLFTFDTSARCCVKLLVVKLTSHSRCLRPSNHIAFWSERFISSDFKRLRVSYWDISNFVMPFLWWTIIKYYISLAILHSVWMWHIRDESFINGVGGGEGCGYIRIRGVGSETFFGDVLGGGWRVENKKPLGQVESYISSGIWNDVFHFCLFSLNSVSQGPDRTARPRV